MNSKLCKIDFAFSFMATLEFTHWATQDLLDKNIPGDFVECGVAAGAQIAAMQVAMVQRIHFRNIIGFDSFEGIPLAGPKDDSQPGLPGPPAHDVNLPERERLKTSGITSFSADQVLANFRRLDLPLDNLNLVKGWFQDTVPVWAKQINAIALLRLDGDLYESTKVCLEYLYEKVAPGGMVIIDDYALAGCKLAVDEFIADQSTLGEVIHLFPIEGGQGPVYWYKWQEISKSA